VVLDNCKNQQDGALLGRLLTGHPNLRVILLDHQNNWMQLYRRVDVPVARSTDLTRLIRFS
jgi:hypothetical protein